MNVLEVQSAIVELLSAVYDKAHVVVSGQNATMPPAPYVVVSFKNLTKAPGYSSFLTINDGVETKCFSMSLTFNVELVTFGVSIADGVQPIDTSVNDLEQFALFLNGEHASYFLQERNMNIETMGDCIPIYNLRNEVSVPFRAQLNLRADFMQTVEDAALIRSPDSDYKQTGSGASSVLAEKKDGYFTDVTVKYKE